ncbi:polysaccharide deacetylase family protein [Paenibacillus sp. HB172176]|uniref:polysaccharide deacetylase family protein n=1 Tax=Paenibacillus sp. HB172176 TaxID=2493690 RepID=UPI001439B6CF|nr:polysaccharide deacetylase family protein [Paenibacillus sp. HB172176]
MRKRWKTAASVILALQLAGCSNSGSGTTAEQPASTTIQATAVPTSTATAAPTAPEPTPSATPATETKLYKMSSVYRFAPINDSNELSPAQVVLLTFDDGPHNKQVLTSLLDTLDKHHAKAIFFVNGYRVKQNPDLLKLIHERKQTIGNHSYDHINLKQETIEVIEKQVGDVSQQVEDLIGERPSFFRPPYGAGNQELKDYVADQSMLYMTWSDGSLDWDASAKNKPDVVIKNVMEQLHKGANILMHELQWTADALDELLTKLEDAGYGFIDPETIDTDFTS